MPKQFENGPKWQKTEAGRHHNQPHSTPRSVAPVWHGVFAILVFFFANSAAADPCAIDAETPNSTGARDPTESSGQARIAELPAEYHDLIDRALAESAEGRWEEARVAFREAHQIFPNARTLRGIGMVAFELRDYVDAYRSWKAALSEPCRALTKEQLNQLEPLLERARGFLAAYDTTHLPKDATYSIDGRHTRPETTGQLLLGLGSHELVVEDEGRRTEAVLHIRGGESGALPILLQDPSDRTAGSTTRSTRAVPPPVEAPPPPSVEKKPRAVPITLIATGAAAFAAGLGVFLAGQSQLSKVENAQEGTSWSEVSDASRRGTRQTAIGGALMGVGAVAAGIGGGILLWPRGPHGERGLSLSIRGAF